MADQFGRFQLVGFDISVDGINGRLDDGALRVGARRCAGESRHLDEVRATVATHTAVEQPKPGMSTTSGPVPRTVTVMRSETGSAMTAAACRARRQRVIKVDLRIGLLLFLGLGGRSGG